MNSLSNEKRQKVICLTTGAFNPIHRGHIEILKNAMENLDKDKFDVIGGILSPSSDIYVQKKLPGSYCFEKRVKFARLGIGEENYPNITCNTWEGEQDRFVDFPEVREHFQEEMSSKQIKVLYVCGADHVNKCKLWNKDWVVCIGRIGEIVNEERKCIYLEGNSDVIGHSSTKIRNILESDLTKPEKEIELKKLTYDSVAKELI